MKLLLVNLIVFFSSCIHAGEVIHEIILHPENTKAKVEVFWQKPDGKGPYPALILIHGHQGQKRIGAEPIASQGYFEEITKKGFVAIAVSQSGYGKTTGGPDNCGKNSQAAVRAAIQFARNQKFIMPDKIVLMGSSMGASISAIIASQDEKLAGAVLASGIYDQEQALLRLAFYGETNPENKLLHDQLQMESGDDENRFVIRSALFHTDKIKIPLLILSGLGDQIAPVEQSISLHSKVLAAGGKSRLMIFPFAGHNIRPEFSGPHIIHFLEEVLRKN